MKPNKKIIREHNASSGNFVDEDELIYLLHEENSVVKKRQYFSDILPEITSLPIKEATNEISAPEQFPDTEGDSDKPNIQFRNDFCNIREIAAACREFADVNEEFKNKVLLVPKKNSHKETNVASSEKYTDITTKSSSEEDNLLLLALEYSNDNSLGEEIDSEWLALAGEVEEFDIETKSSYNDVEIDGTIEDTERALQAAMEVGSAFDLEIRQTTTIATIFEKNGWGNCRIAVERELKQGRSIYELQLASEIKELWLEHYEFYSGQLSNYRVLSWPTALRLANSFSGYPSPEEVEQLLTTLYYHWSQDKILKYVSPSFNQYLISYLDHVEHGIEFAFEWNIEQEMLYADIFFIPPSTEDIPVLGDYELERALRNVRRNDTWMNEGFCQ